MPGTYGRVAAVTDARLGRLLCLVLRAVFTNVVILGARPRARDGRSFMVVSALQGGDDTPPRGPAVVRVGLISRLRRRFLGPTLQWECVDCGEVHPSNPKRCKSCGSTILRQRRED